MARNTGASASLSALLIGSAAAVSFRVAVPNGLGCHTVTSRADCCNFVDGRDDGYYGGHDCVAAKEGMSFLAGGVEGGPVCQPSCFVMGECSDQGSQAAFAAECPAAPALPDDGSRIPVPMGLGCAEVRDREACCHLVDGRADPPYGGQNCIPARRNTWYEVGDDITSIVCQPECWATGECGDGGNQDARRGFCGKPKVTSLPESALVSQEGATVKPGERLRFYVIGSSNAAWQTWIGQMHATLRRMGYQVTLPSTDIPGEENGPVGRRVPKCDDAQYYETLETPRLGLQGWSTWGFAYDSQDDCDATGHREIAGWNVSCTNGWACTTTWRGPLPYVAVSTIAKGVKDANVVVLANFCNDGRNAAYCPHECYGEGNVPTVMETTDITAEGLKRTIRAIHKENPSVVVLVLARYSDAKQILYVNDRTEDDTHRLNAAIKKKVETEPNTHFVDFQFPVDVPMFQTLNTGHANCRGDKLMAEAVVNAMYEHKVISTGLNLGDEECLARMDCGSLSMACCQRSVLCHINPEGQCAPYSTGLQ